MNPNARTPENPKGELEELVIERPAPFNWEGSFGLAKFLPDANVFVPQVFRWDELENEHVEERIDEQSFSFPADAEKWIQDQVPSLTWFNGSSHYLEIRTDPQAPSRKYETHFVVAKENLPVVEAKCSELGLLLETSDVDRSRILRSWAINLRHYDNDCIYRSALNRRAEEAAKGYVNVHIRAPKAEKQVVAIAKKEGGLPVFHTLPGTEEGFWTAERIADIDFHRCDQCGARHFRTKVFLVRNKDGEIEQYGGSCAKNLNLANLVDTHLRALKALNEFIGGGGDRDDYDLGGGFGGRASVVNVELALVIADIMIGRHGYISGSAAYNNDELISTKHRVLDALGMYLGWYRLHPTQKEDYRKLCEAIDAYPLKRRVEMIERAEAFVSKKKAEELSEFTNNLFVAVKTGAIKLLGFVVWIPSVFRKEDGEEAARKIRSDRTPYNPEAIGNGADLRSFIAKWFKGDKEMFCAEIGAKQSSVDKALKNEDKELTKGLKTKLERCVPGVWTIGHIRSFQGDFGTTHFVSLLREEDGAAISWKTSNFSDRLGASLFEGDRIVIHGATVGEIPPPYTNPRTNKTWQDGRRINRVSCSKAEE